MVCLTSCAITFVFIIAMVYFHTATYVSQIATKYQSSLKPEQLTIYRNVVKERSKIAYQGYALGLLLSGLYLWYNKVYATQKMRLSNVSTVCVVVSIMFVTNYFYYMLTPKSNYMLNHLTEQKEIQNWLHMYRTMQSNYHYGLLFGIAAAGAASWTFCSK